MNRLVVILSVLLTLLSHPLEASEQGSPRFLAHILGYIALDYGGAVSKKGIVNDAAEYEEMVEFSNIAIAESLRIKETALDNEVKSGVLTLQKMILQKSEFEVVAPIARRLEARVAMLCLVRRIPTEWPSIAHGEKRFAQNCASCHGTGGAGDGPSGGSLKPPPSNFLDGSRMASMTPFNMFNAIRLGVPGTAMASFDLSDDETWELAFFVASLRHRGIVNRAEDPHLSLADLSEKTDLELLAQLKGSLEESTAELAVSRTYQAKKNEVSQFIEIAEERLRDAMQAVQEKEWGRAEKFALAAYLDGVEVLEPQLRARDSQFVAELEKNMSAVRIAIAGRRDEISELVLQAMESLEKARSLLKGKTSSPLFTVFMSMGIVLREAMEAVLILIAILGVVRSAKINSASRVIHLGWASALLAGFCLWIFSGWVVRLSGFNREILEGSITLLAVCVLLYFGFWLHRKSEIGRWREFLGEITLQLTDKKKMIGLFGVAFMAVFREAFETVLFLRALSLESTAYGDYSIGIGVILALGIAGSISAWALYASERLPTRQIFLVSSTLLVFLAVTLIGKAIHSFQEAGTIGMSIVTFGFRSDLFGVYPTWETSIAQMVILGGALLVFLSGSGFWKPKCQA